MQDRKLVFLTPKCLSTLNTEVLDFEIEAPGYLIKVSTSEV